MYKGMYIWDSVRSAQVNGRGAKVKVYVSAKGSFLARTFYTIVIITTLVLSQLLYSY